MRPLVKPTRGRIALWSLLAFLWFLLLPQYLAMAGRPADVSVAGAALWAIVFCWLVSCAWVTWRRYRAGRSGPPGR